MMGTGTFAEPTFEALLTRDGLVVGLITQPDRAAGTIRGSTRQTGRGMKAIAAERGIPVAQPESVNTPEGMDALKSMSPEVLVVAAYGQILSKDVLAIPTRGGINVHASMLPSYRGAAPVAWAIYHGESRTGVTIIRMTTGLDAGDILAQEPLDILPDETAGDLEARLAPLGARLALDVVDRMCLGPVTGMAQDKSKVSKAPKLKKEDGLIDWTRPAEQVTRQIRAMQPFPTAYTFLHRQDRPVTRLQIVKAIAEPGPVTSELPGAIAVIDGKPRRLLVACGQGTRLEVLELLPEGKRRMPAEEFLRGRPVKPGDSFGPEQRS
jgi:methionyl-tRNA formyltransferase